MSEFWSNLQRNYRKPCFFYRRFFSNNSGKRRVGDDFVSNLKTVFLKTLFFVRLKEHGDYATGTLLTRGDNKDGRI